MGSAGLLAVALIEARSLLTLAHLVAVRQHQQFEKAIAEKQAKETCQMNESSDGYICAYAARARACVRVCVCVCVCVRARLMPACMRVCV